MLWNWNLYYTQYWTHSDHFLSTCSMKHTLLINALLLDHICIAAPAHFRLPSLWRQNTPFFRLNQRTNEDGRDCAEQAAEDCAHTDCGGSTRPVQWPSACGDAVGRSSKDCWTSIGRVSRRNTDIWVGAQAHVSGWHLSDGSHYWKLLTHCEHI